MSLLRADAQRLPLRGETIQCVVTSPPYWQLRDYSVLPVTWDDVPTCRHLWDTDEDAVRVERSDDAPGQALTPRSLMSVTCRRCGAWRGALGLEPTLDLYISHLVGVFREVWRVLRPDGVCWLNLGDSYAGSWGAQSRTGAEATHRVSCLSARQIDAHPQRIRTGSLTRTPGLKPKDLCLIPARVALRLQAEGWYVRAEVIWAKPNPMPESVRDRPTKAHEYILLLTKRAAYYWDADAVREPHALDSLARVTRGGSLTHKWADRGPGRQTLARDLARACHRGGRNLRSVWTIAPEGYSGLHFATMPEAVARRCILAGSRSGDWVLDPFVGVGTVVRVAIALGRRGVGGDLNGGYLRSARERCVVTRGLPWAPASPG